MKYFLTELCSWREMSPEANETESVKTSTDEIW